MPNWTSGLVINGRLASERPENFAGYPDLELVISPYKTYHSAFLGGRGRCLKRKKIIIMFFNTILTVKLHYIALLNNHILEVINIFDYQLTIFDHSNRLNLKWDKKYRTILFQSSLKFGRGDKSLIRVLYVRNFNY